MCFFDTILKDFTELYRLYGEGLPEFLQYKFYTDFLGLDPNIVTKQILVTKTALLSFMTFLDGVHVGLISAKILTAEEGKNLLTKYSKLARELLDMDFKNS